MNYQQFLDYAIRELTEKAGEQAEVQFKSIVKNNGISLDAVIIRREGNKIAPAIYVEAYYALYCNGADLELVIDKMYQNYLKYNSEEKIEAMEQYQFGDWEQIQHKIVFRLVNLEKNENLLSKVPHIRILDMALIFYVMVDWKAYENAGFLIYLEHLKLWNTTTEEVYQCAMENSPKLFPVKFCSMEDILNELICKQMAEHKEMSDCVINPLEMGQREGIRMYVLTNQCNFHGAATIFYPGVLSSLTVTCGTDFYIIPSSVHEVIIILKEDGAEPEELKGMIRDINQKEVAEEEVLSDNLYYYDSIQDSIEFC